jgi:hypothetical protein
LNFFAEVNGKSWSFNPTNTQKSTDPPKPFVRRKESTISQRVLHDEADGRVVFDVEKREENASVSRMVNEAKIQGLGRSPG